MVEVAQGLQLRKWAYWTEPEWVDVNGVRTAYRRKGAGEPLLFLHGAGLTRAWLPLYEELSKSFDVIVPEHPGYGDTALPEWLEGFDDLVLHYHAFLRVLGVEKAHIAGHSLGAWIAADLTIFYPEKFSSMTLLAPMGLRVPEAPLGDAFRWSPEAALETLFSGVGENYLEFLEQGDPVDNALHSYQEDITFALLTWNPRYDYKLEHRLARLHVPSLIIGFADDRYVPLQHPKKWAALIPNASLEILQGAEGEPASHLAIVQQPQVLAELIGSRVGARPKLTS
ncbi:alpha/beta hydrolase [Arthrobacter sp. Cr_A7]|uniref:alpha/beta fold hydrolase n=1 Tax=Arthrobacter sp. Cr_A7 TaxID=3031017 RepID=UPI0023DB666D|nr:alpha/beta hydrolase [Arthrobacter sp. Cr_A7]MDF2050423.1 alpha/beta hydrolase [Arthrobacter sp. Cr_A7]